MQQPESRPQRQATAVDDGGPDLSAPPKQVAIAMDRLSQASRIIADLRLGADRLLEVLFLSVQPRQTSHVLKLLAEQDNSMTQHLQDLHDIGRLLGESGCLNESPALHSNSWCSCVPLVCPDGAAVGYAWKRQLASHAGSSAVDRSRLALNAFMDLKRRFFPHYGDGLDGQIPGSFLKLHDCQTLPMDGEGDLSDGQVLSNIIIHLEKEMPNLKIFTYERLEWLRRGASLSTSANENVVELQKGYSKCGSFKMKDGLRPSSGNGDEWTVIELLLPSVFRAVVSLHPAGSVDPDAVAFFSPDEGGSYVHARGCSIHHVFRQITEHASVALQHFLGMGSKSAALSSLLKWVGSYETLFTEACRKCGRLLAADPESMLLLPPVCRPYQCCFSSSKQACPLGSLGAYHAACILDG